MARGHRGDAGGLLFETGAASPFHHPSAIGHSIAADRKTSDFLDFVTYNQKSAEGEARARECVHGPWGRPPIWTEEAMGAMRLAAKRMFVRGGGP